jgi:ABC-type sugar transport system ATPase subunit
MGKLLELKDVSYQTPLSAVEHIFCSFDHSDCTYICGRPSEGVSLLVRIITGKAIISTGEILYNNSLISNEKLMFVVSYGGHRFLSNIERQSVFRNIITSSGSRFSTFGFIQHKKAECEIRYYFDKFQCSLSLQKAVHTLSANERAVYLTVKTLLSDADVLVFDNYIDKLHKHQMHILYECIHILKKTNKSIIILSKNPENHYHLFDRIYFLNNTELQEIPDTEKISVVNLKKMINGEELLPGDLQADPIMLAVQQMSKSLDCSTLNFHSVAAGVGLSYENFRKIFKRQTGCSPNAYFIRLKMQKAMEYVKKTDIKIYKISELLGYDSPGYFIKQFKKQYSVSPESLRHTESE